MVNMQNGSYQGPLLGNYKKERRAALEEALRMYRERGGKLIIYILEKASNDRGRVMPDYISLNTGSRGEEHGEFWRVLEEVDAK